MAILLCACGGARTVPVPFGSDLHGARVHRADGTTIAPGIAIDAGGAAAGTFVADTDYSANGTWTKTVTATIATAQVANPAPQAVYQTQRTGRTITYTVPNLTAGAAYTVQLDFCELYWTAGGSREFNVTLNGQQVLTNFDIFATAGAADTAIAQAFTVNASATGSIAIVLTATIDNATINGIEIAPAGGSATPAPSPSTTPSPASSTAASGIFIDAGGAAAGNFIADTDFSANGTWTKTVTAPIATALEANPAPQAVYQSQRTGKTIAYTIAGLTPSANYTVQLDFSELYWTAAGKRTFNVAINGQTVLSNFDIFATAGGEDAAVSESFATMASTSGTIAIALTAVLDNATIDGIEITPNASGAPPPTPAPTATAVPTATPQPGGLAIDAGGPAFGTFVADEDYGANGTWTKGTAAAINTNAVANPAPQGVYQWQRTGKAFSYTIPNLVPGGSYAVRLDFAELYWSAAGQRVFDVAIDGAPVLTNFDIVAAAGSAYAAVAESSTTTVPASGAMTIAFTSVTDNATVNGIEVVPLAMPAATAAPTPTPAATAAPTPSPTPSATIVPQAFNDYVTFAYDNQHDAFNPNSTAFTPASLASLHLAWQAALGGGDYNTLSQPILATEIPGHAGVLFSGGGSGNVYGYDALTGAMLWKQNTGQATYACQSGQTIYFGVGGTAAYDPGSASLYIVGNQNPATNAPLTNTLYHIDGAGGTILGSVAIAPQIPNWPSLDFAHTAVTLGSNGVAYVGTGATCDISEWRGRVAAVQVPAMTVASTFYPVWNGSTQPWGGGGVWGWGGVSLDAAGNVYTGTGNADDGSGEHGTISSPYQAAPSETSGYGDAVVQLSGDLSTLEAADQPIPAGVINDQSASTDLDVAGTPVLFQSSGTGCPLLAALQGKAGSLYLFNAGNIGAGPLASYQLAPSTYADGFLGSPAYSPVTGLLYADVSSSNQSLYPPGMIAINPGCGSPNVVWNTAFGPDSYTSGSSTAPGLPRSVPAVSAGGVIFVGTSCTVSGSTCAAVTTNARRAHQGLHHLICCAPPGASGGALWAIDANTGNVLNGGEALLFTGGPLRVPPTIDGNWVFVLDNDGDLYGLTIDPAYPATNARFRLANPRQVKTLNRVHPG